MPNEGICLLNPTSGEVVSRANQLEATQTHSTQRGIRNADTFDKYLNDIIARDFNLTSTVMNLALVEAGIQTDSAGNENQSTQQDSDTSKKTVETANVALATSIGNLATAVLPILTAAAGEGTALTYQQLTAFLANIVSAATPPAAK